MSIEQFLLAVNTPQIMYLQIKVLNSELKTMYVEAVNKHNNKVISEPEYYDSGFDIFLPELKQFDSCNVNKVDFRISCAAKIIDKESRKSYYTGYYTYARSSISKTPIRLANNQGIIDSGYRGSLIGMFDCAIYDKKYEAEMGTRLLQICAPNLMPIYVEVVDDLGAYTSRGSGGFGSTGI